MTARPAQTKPAADDFPAYARGERVVDTGVHVLGLGAAIVGVAVLMTIVLRQAGDMRLTLGAAIYGASLLTMLGCSALYSATPPSPRKAFFRRLDHAAIFLMIAGTCAPFALGALDDLLADALLYMMGAVALIGAALKIFAPRALPNGVSSALYLLVGWGGIAAISPAFATLPLSALVLLGAGGILYSVGVAVHHSERLPFHNAIWHGFVLAAAACHYAAILDGVVLRKAAG